MMEVSRVLIVIYFIEDGAEPSHDYLFYEQGVTVGKKRSTKVTCNNKKLATF